MKAIVVLKPGVAVFKNDVPAPQPGPYEALVKVGACAFCNGTDMHIINGTTDRQSESSYPIILGHEACGEAVELGEKVRYIHIGDRFIRPDTPPKYGEYTNIYGNMAEYALAVDRQAMLEDGFKQESLPSEQNCGRIPSNISFVDGSVMLSLLECLSALHNFGFASGMDVLVYGAGPMGLGVVNFLNILGARTVALTDMSGERLRNAGRRFNIHYAIDVSRQKTTTVLSGRLFDMVIDLAGSADILLEGTNLLKPGGKLCSMGVLSKKGACLDLTKLKNNSTLHMLNDPCKRLSYMDDLVQMIDNGSINLKNFYSHVLSVEDIEEGLRLISKKEALKVVFTF